MNNPWRVLGVTVFTAIVTWVISGQASAQYQTDRSRQQVQPQAVPRGQQQQQPFQTQVSSQPLAAARMRVARLGSRFA